jgi:hypothetical protein
MLDTQFIQLRLIRKKFTKEMRDVAQTLRKAARKGMLLEEMMAKEAEAIMMSNARVPMASFLPNSKTLLQDIKDGAEGIIHLVNKTDNDTTIVICKEQSAEYARKMLGIVVQLPKDWNPATHYHQGDMRPLTPTYRDEKEYRTPAGGWIVETAEEDCVPGTP